MKKYSLIQARYAWHRNRTAPVSAVSLQMSFTCKCNICTVREMFSCKLAQFVIGGKTRRKRAARANRGACTALTATTGKDIYSTIEINRVLRAQSKTPHAGACAVYLAKTTRPHDCDLALFKPRDET
jgi:hypothetical protein